MNGHIKNQKFKKNKKKVMVIQGSWYIWDLRIIDINLHDTQLEASVPKIQHFAHHDPLLDDHGSNSAT